MKHFLSVMSLRTKIKCLGVILLAFVSSLLASLWPVRLGELYTSISGGTVGTLGQGMAAIAAFGGIYLMAECTTILRRIVLECIISTHEAEIRAYSIRKLLRMPVAYYANTLSGEKTAQLNQGVAGYSQLIKIMCNDVFATVLVAVCTLVQVFLNAPSVMVWLMLLYMAVTVTISAFQIHSQNGIREKIIRQKNSLDGQICQSISNLELIRAMYAEDYETRRIHPAIYKVSRTEKFHHRYMGTFDGLKQIFKIVFQVILLTVSMLLITKGEMPDGAVITVCLLFQQLIKPIDEVYRCVDETASSYVKAKALLEVFDAPEDDVFAPAMPWTETLVLPRAEIHMENVLVTNPEKSKALARYQDITIPIGPRIALRGSNGCGKTSLIRCLTRFYPHTRGKITLFDRPQETYTQQELADMLYYTPQTSFFIAGTVRENLVYGLDRDVGDDELAEALHMVHLTGDDHPDTVIRIDAKQALDVRIGERANELSGGMRQRLALARAFLRRPKLYIFDEITANLDKDAIDRVLHNIEQYAETIGAGILYISHDPTVVERCDLVITLDNQLKRRESAYAA